MRHLLEISAILRAKQLNGVASCDASTTVRCLEGRLKVRLKFCKYRENKGKKLWLQAQ